MGWGVLEFGEEVREFGGEVGSNFGRFHDLNMNNPKLWMSAGYLKTF